MITLNYPQYLKKYALAVCTGLLLLLNGCAATQTASTTGASSANVNHLRNEQQQLVQRIDQLQTNLLLLEVRVMDQQKLIERLRKTKPVPVPGVTQPAPQPQATSLTPAELYRKAFAAYAAGRYAEGLADFKRFVTLFPTSEYAANANYWLAECHLAQNEYTQAATVYREIAQEYAQSAIAPKALWKEALALTRAGAEQKAAKVLRTLHKRYPGSKAAKKPLPTN